MLERYSTYPAGCGMAGLALTGAGYVRGRFASRCYAVAITATRGNSHVAERGRAE